MKAIFNTKRPKLLTDEIITILLCLTNSIKWIKYWYIGWWPHLKARHIHTEHLGRSLKWINSIIRMELTIATSLASVFYKISIFHHLFSSISSIRNCTNERDSRQRKKSVQWFEHQDKLAKNIEIPRFIWTERKFVNIWTFRCLFASVWMFWSTIYVELCSVVGFGWINTISHFEKCNELYGMVHEWFYLLEVVKCHTVWWIAEIEKAKKKARGDFKRISWFSCAVTSMCGKQWVSVLHIYRLVTCLYIYLLNRFAFSFSITEREEKLYPEHNRK